MAIVLNYPDQCPICKSLKFYPIIPDKIVNDETKEEEEVTLEDGKCYFHCAACNYDWSVLLEGTFKRKKLYFMSTPGGDFPYGLILLDSNVELDNATHLHGLSTFLNAIFTKRYGPENHQNLPVVPIELLLAKGQSITKEIEHYLKEHPTDKIMFDPEVQRKKDSKKKQKRK